MPTKNTKTKARRTAKAVGSSPLVRPKSFDSAPNDGTKILAYSKSEECWKLCFGDNNGRWFGDHHSSTYGTELYAPNLTHWLPQLPKPA